MPNEKPPGPPHTIDDHLFGEVFAHEHDGDADHDHDDVDPGPLEENPIWLRDNVALTSVGIDIGSAGTQLIFSTVHLQRKADSHASRYVIVDRRTAYESPVRFTPFTSGHEIDAGELGRIIDDAYAGAGIRPSDIDTGVVILTGEALRRRNAEAIARIVAEKGGDFVTATAGNHMEAMLAAYGSGAAKLSHDLAAKVLNVDIGGGTTKLALVEAGDVRWTAALHIGGRLIAAKDGRVTRAEPAGRHFAAAAGHPLTEGDPVTPADLQAIAAHMANLLTGVISGQPIGPETAELFLTDIPEIPQDLAAIVFSGGVGAYVSGQETRDFGDLGLPLGRIIGEKARSGALGAPLRQAVSAIRATALGASEYSVQLSGQTSTVTAPGRSLPRRNMQVLKPTTDLADAPSPETIAQAVRDHYSAFDLDPAQDEAVLAFEFRTAPEYAAIRRLADGIAAALPERIAAQKTLYLMIDGDIAQTLGGILAEELAIASDLLILDGISLRDFDYIDLGKIRLPSFTVPVTVKSLLFSEDPRGARRQERIGFAPKPHAHTHDHSHDHSHDH